MTIERHSVSASGTDTVLRTLAKRAALPLQIISFRRDKFRCALSRTTLPCEKY